MLVPGVCIVLGVQTRLEPPVAGEMVRVAERTTPPAVAVMVAVPDALAPATAVNPAEEAPDGTDTEVGTLTCALLLLNATVTPAVPAKPVRDTVHALGLPAATVSGEQVTEASVACAETASENVTEPPLRPAVSTADPACTPVALKFALDDAAGTTTVGGTETAVLPLDSDTVTAEAAGAVRNTVQLLVALRAIVPGLHDRLARAACAWIVKAADLVTPAEVAEIVAVC